MKFQGNKCSNSLIEISSLFKSKCLPLSDFIFFSNYGVNVNYVACDLRNLSEIDHMVAEIFKLYPSGVDILINNAGKVF